MKANLEPILDVLGMPDRCFRIPVFQRVYSWTERQCMQLLADVQALVREDEEATHFLGTLIYMPEKSEAGPQYASLIDGQQRLTTLTLLLIAMRDRLATSGTAEERCLAAWIDETYLCNGDEAKLVLSCDDAKALCHLVFGQSAFQAESPNAEGAKEGPSSLEEEQAQSAFLLGNEALFARMIDQEGADCARLLAALERLTVIVVQLDDDDAPQQVFESLNAKGKPLSTTDLLRNMLLLEHGFDEQERLFNIYWAPIDAAFEQFAPEDDIYLDAALHAWLTSTAPDIKIGKRSDLYQAFKEYLAMRDDAPEDLLRSISSSCLSFAKEPASPEAREHVDWVIDKPKGLVSERKLFGD